MRGEPDHSDQGDTEPVDEAEALRLILALAEALREEFGVGIDAHPGGKGNEAGVVNRALRAAVEVILRSSIPPGGDLKPMLTWTLRRAASLRLAELGLRGDQIASILALEPGLGDRWWAYLALSPASVLEDLP